MQRSHKTESKNFERVWKMPSGRWLVLGTKSPTSPSFKLMKGRNDVLQPIPAAVSVLQAIRLFQLSVRHIHDLPDFRVLAHLDLRKGDA